MPAQDWKLIGESHFTQLTDRGRHPARIRNLMRAAEGRLLEETMTAEDRATVRELVTELRATFAPGASLMIVQAAHRAASYADRKRKRVES